MDNNQKPTEEVITVWRLTEALCISEYKARPHPWKHWAEKDHWVLFDQYGYPTRYSGKRGKDFFDTKEEATEVAMKKIKKRISRLEKKALELKKQMAPTEESK